MFTLCVMFFFLSFMAFFVLLFLALIKLFTKKGPALKKLFIIDIVIFIVSMVGACLLDDDSSSTTNSEQTVGIIQTTEAVTEITTEVTTEITTQATTQAPTTTTETTVAPTTQVVTEPTTQAPVNNNSGSTSTAPLTNIKYDLSAHWLDDEIFDITVSFKNNTAKEIKYVRFYFYPINAVDDPVYSDTELLTVTGPLGAYKEGSCTFDNIYMESTADDIVIAYIEIEYRDGTFDYM